MKKCPYCGEEIQDEAQKCKHCGEWLEVNTSEISNIQETTIIDNSKNNKGKLPKEYIKFNWGAFLLNWIWGIGNKTYLPVWCFSISVVLQILLYVFFTLPLTLAEGTEVVVSNLIINSAISSLLGIGYFIFAIWLGFKGNEFAWKNKDWNNLDHFNNVQRKWAKWAVIIVGSIIILYLLLIILSIIMVTIGIAGGV